MRVFRLKFDPKAINADIINAAFWSAEHSGIEVKDDELLIYVEDSKLNEADILFIVEQHGLKEKVEVTSEVLKDQNWNKAWEANFAPILIKNKVFVRADFHQSRPEMLELIIHPRMTFGTGHHETTRGMMELMTELNFTGKSVVDMGCGTGILGIYALKSKASFVDFIDNDKHCYENTIENIQKNELAHQHVFLTDRLDNGKKYDYILANIHKNIILDQLADYKRHLKPSGKLLISGFYENDKDEIIEKAKQNGLCFEEENLVKDWLTIKLKYY